MAASIHGLPSECLKDEKVLKQHKANLKRALTRYLKLISTITTSTLVQEADINRLAEQQEVNKHLLSEFYATMALLGPFEAAQADVDKELDEFERRVVDADAAARALIKTFKSTAPATTTSAQPPKRDTMSHARHLPKIRIPAFKGNPTNWLEFKDLFASLVHDSDELRDIDKFHYLRGCLEGDVVLVISNIATTAENYPLAWAALCNRFDNKTSLIDDHLDALFSIPGVTNESAKGLRQLVDGVNKNLHALCGLGENVDAWSTILLHIISRKADYKTRREWEQLQIPAPTVNGFLDHLLSKAIMLEKLQKSGELSATKRAEVNKPPESAPRQASQRATSAPRQRQSYVTQVSCVCCQQQHALHMCPQFLKLSHASRMQVVSETNSCRNCLRAGHSDSDCTSKGRCFKCQQRHHTQLHKATSAPAPQGATSTLVQAPQCNAALDGSLSILPTAVVNIHSAGGQSIKVRALLDSCSQCNLITEQALQCLSVTGTETALTIRGICGQINEAGRYVKLQVMSNNGSFKATIIAFVVPRIADNVPSEPIDKRSVHLPPGLMLADNTFHKPGPIDLLLGNDHFWQILQPHQVRRPNAATLQSTTFGWIVCGRYTDVPARSPVGPQCLTVTTSLDRSLQRFWVVEEPPETTPPRLSTEQQYCETLFTTTTRRDDDGRFVVRLPHSADLRSAPAIDTYHSAKRRLINMEKRLHNQPVIRQPYVDFLREYQALNHMVAIDHSATAPAFYLPHHAVQKADSETTKVRVVFDGSCRMSNNSSINDYLYNGMCTQRDLLYILMQFRLHRYAATADVEKMYRQVSVHPDDRFMQHILWREQANTPITSFQLNTLTYGTKSAAYLAIRCLHEVGERCKLPEVRRAIQACFYVDDLLIGHDDEAALGNLCKQIHDELGHYCLSLRKWRSNAPAAHTTNNDTPQLLADGLQPTTTLGMIWDPVSDLLSYKSSLSNVATNNMTKRKALSIISQVYDPLGLASPVTITAKLFMQLLWISQYDWDVAMSPAHQQDFVAILRDLQGLEATQIPRQAKLQHGSFALHTYCDASEKAYGAAVYVRSERHGCVSSRLLCSKTRVAPLKTLTVPKLELCAAVLAAKLTSGVCSALGIDVATCHFWSDSTVVLSWLSTPVHALRIFVANRVDQICSTTSSAQWHHVAGETNPADLCSRGVTTAQLMSSTLWWNGPSALTQDADWPTYHAEPAFSIPELKCHVTQVIPPVVLEFSRYSSYTKLMRVMMYVQRFITNLRSRRSQVLPREGTFTYDDRRAARRSLIRLAQIQAYAREISALQEGKDLPCKSALRTLTPFVDNDGILRIRGRVRNPNMDADERQPALLSSGHPLATLLFASVHRTHLHCGPQFLIAETRRFVWVPRARDLARKVIRECLICFKAKPTRQQPLMGDLPVVRTTPAPAFASVGIDCAGPLAVSSSHLRGSRAYKAYIVLFVCMATKAVHLELVTELSTPAFMAAFRRFCARRGAPRDIFSDNGKNFIGAARELAAILRQAAGNPDSLPEDFQGQWHFIPPYAPHFGGLWEAAIKQAKYHLRKTLGDAIVTYEELTTLLCQIEAILNSRPLLALSDDPTDFNPITPAHFLIGRPMHAVPDRQVDVNINLRVRFRRMQHLHQCFWTEWSKAYLQSLQIRAKWRQDNPRANLQPNELVLVHEDNVPSRRWRCGRIIDISPGADNIVRVASVNTAKGVISRSVQRLYRLPLQDPTSEGDLPVALRGGAMLGIDSAQGGVGDPATSPPLATAPPPPPPLALPPPPRPHPRPPRGGTGGDD